MRWWTFFVPIGVDKDGKRAQRPEDIVRASVRLSRPFYLTEAEAIAARGRYFNSNQVQLGPVKPDHFPGNGTSAEANDLQGAGASPAGSNRPRVSRLTRRLRSEKKNAAA